jgi:hypothetical protein
VFWETIASSDYVFLEGETKTYCRRQPRQALSMRPAPAREAWF